MPDRYADAVRARRLELHAQRALLTGGHRADLRVRLALARIACTAELAEELAALGRQLRTHVERADRRGRARLPGEAAAAAQRLADDARRRRADAVLPAVRRLAAERGLLPGLHWPRPPAPPGPVALPGPADGDGADPVAPWRVVVPLAGLPAVVLPAVGLPTLVPIALAAALVLAAVTRRAAADRARLRAWAVDVPAALRTRLVAELEGWLVELERVAGAELDAAAARRRAAIDAELRALAPTREPARAAS